MKYKSLFWIGLLALLVEIYSVRPPRMETAKERPYLLGAFHVHSHYSHDGGGSVEEIAAAANQTGLDFVIITDHNTDQGFREGKAKRYHDTDVFVENEVSVEMGHITTLYTHTKDRDLPAGTIGGFSHTDVLGEKQLDKDSFQVIAHPLSPARPWTRLDKFSKGIEVINLDSLWRQKLKSDPLELFAEVLLFSLNQFAASLALYEAPRKNIEIWDQMNSISSGHFGILAHDTHSRIDLLNLRVRWPAYAPPFRVAANVVFPTESLSIDFETRQKQIYRWISQGRLALFFRLLHPYDEYSWKISCAQKQYLSGDSIKDPTNCSHQITRPAKSRYPHFLRLFKNGKLHVELPLPATQSLPLEGEGTYRAEIWAEVKSLTGLTLRKKVPILLYNPIYAR